MIMIFPFLLITLHFSHIGLTEDLTFIVFLLSKKLEKSSHNSISPEISEYKHNPYLFRQVILPLLRSYGDISTVTLSPGRIRI